MVPVFVYLTTPTIVMRSDNPGSPRTGPGREARGQRAAGGVLARALADALESFDEAQTEPPPPDVVEHAGTVYASRPVAVRDEGEHVAIERIRETVDPAGHRTAEPQTAAAFQQAGA